MTKANDNANKERKDLERRVRRKLSRLENKGIRTGSISPIKNIDTANTRSVKSYNKQMRDFMKRENQYVAGYDGTPIKEKDWREYQKLEKRRNEVHLKRLNDYRDKTLIGQDMTILQKAAITSRSTIFNAIEYMRNLTPEKVKGAKDLKRRTGILKRELSPNYLRNRANRLREDVLKTIDIYNSSELKQKFEKLSNRQLQRLQNESLFVEDFFTFNYGWTDDEWQSRIEYLIEIIDTVNPPKKSKRSRHRSR